MMKLPIQDRETAGRELVHALEDYREREHLVVLAAAKLDCHHGFKIVPGASHLFEEPGKLDIVQEAAADWFTDHLTGAQP